jgi:tetratricopeptide (TPR) repeat protein
MDQIRHTYLHYLLDPLALKYPASIKRLEPLQAAVKVAPMDEGFKSDMSLLVTECFIRAIEARMAGSGRASETERLKLVDSSGDQGFILTAYFYEALARFEKDPAGLREAYGDLVNNIDVRKEQKRASQITFASTSTPELLQLSQPKSNLLVTAEQRLSAGDSAAAQKLAQQALEEKNEDPGRALFILAEVATHNSDMQGARNYFERAIQVAHEPKVVAWSHIYLGRIFDLQADRAAALDHYRAAETAGTGLPEAKAAAEQGLQQPYEPPGHPQ